MKVFQRCIIPTCRETSQDIFVLFTSLRPGFCVLYPTLLHLPPHRFHMCWHAVWYICERSHCVLCSPVESSLVENKMNRRRPCSLSLPFSLPWLLYNLCLIIQSFLLGQTHLNEVSRADYETFRSEAVYGWFIMGKPVLGVNSLDLVKNILVKDFNSFVDRTSTFVNDAFRSGGDLDKVEFFLC